MEPEFSSLLLEEKKQISLITKLTMTKQYTPFVMLQATSGREAQKTVLALPISPYAKVSTSEIDAERSRTSCKDSGHRIRGFLGSRSCRILGKARARNWQSWDP
jgi:hypothetical protein